jgi:hypothetical protein
MYKYITVFLGSLLLTGSAFAADASVPQKNSLLSAVDWVVDEVKDNTSFKEEFAKHATPKTLYDFHQHEFLAGADMSVASYRIAVAEVGWAKSIETVNTRGTVLGGITLQLNRSQLITSTLQSVTPGFDLGLLDKLALGGFAGYDADSGQIRYGAYVGLVFKFFNNLLTPAAK